MLALSAIYNLELVQFDVSTAFLTGVVQKTIYVEPPEGVNVKHDQCLQLNKALYGLKQAPRAWNSRLNEVLSEKGFYPIISDQCVYTNNTSKQYILVYVDDGIIIGPDREQCVQTFHKLEAFFKIKMLEGTSFLGMEIIRTKDELILSQETSVENIIKRFGMADAKISASPLSDTSELIKNTDNPCTQEPYLQAIECLMYLANCTRPDILYAVNWLSRYNRAPKQNHWVAVKRVIRYLKIRYKRGYELINAYSDSYLAGDEQDRHPTTGALIMFGGGPIVFCSRKQDAVAQSSTESEYIAASEAAKEIKWLTQMLTELKIEYETSTLSIDNQSTIKQIKNGDIKRKSKHVDIKYHFVIKLHRENIFKLQYIHTLDQPADIFTKPLGGPKIDHIVKTCELLAEKKMSNKRNKRNKNTIGIMSKLALMLNVIDAV